MDSYHWAAVQLLCRGEQSEVSEDDGLVDSRSITSLFHRSSSMTHSGAHTGTESYFVSCAILADTISSDSSWGYRTMHHSSTIFYDSGRNHDLDEYKCPVWSKYHFVGSISIIFNSALADDYTAGPNSAIIGRTMGADYAIGEEADQRTMRRQMVSRSDHLWSAPRSIGRSVNQLYFSQFTNRICHNLSSVFLAIYELYFSLIPNCISHNLTAICLSFLAPSFDCIANFLHQMFCRREEWQADHLISPSAKSLSVHQLYFLTILKCICQYWPTVFLHMITDQPPVPPDSLGRPITHLISWFPPREQYLIVQRWQISATHICLSSCHQIEYLSPLWDLPLILPLIQMFNFFAN